MQVARANSDGSEIGVSSKLPTVLKRSAFPSWKSYKVEEPVRQIRPCSSRHVWGNRLHRPDPQLLSTLQPEIIPRLPDFTGPHSVPHSTFGWCFYLHLWCLKIRDLSEIQNLYKHQISSWQTPPKNLGEKIMLPPIFTKWTYQLMLTNSWLRLQWPVPACF